MAAAAVALAAASVFRVFQEYRETAVAVTAWLPITALLVAAAALLVIAAAHQETQSCQAIEAVVVAAVAQLVFTAQLTAPEAAAAQAHAACAVMPLAVPTVKVAASAVTAARATAPQAAQAKVDQAATVASQVSHFQTHMVMVGPAVACLVVVVVAAAPVLAAVGEVPELLELSGVLTERGPAATHTTYHKIKELHNEFTKCTLHKNRRQRRYG